MALVDEPAGRRARPHRRVRHGHARHGPARRRSNPTSPGTCSPTPTPGHLPRLGPDSGRTGLQPVARVLTASFEWFTSRVRARRRAGIHPTTPPPSPPRRGAAEDEPPPRPPAADGIARRSNFPPRMPNNWSFPTRRRSDRRGSRSTAPPPATHHPPRGLTWTADPRPTRPVLTAATTSGNARLRRGWRVRRALHSSGRATGLRRTLGKRPNRDQDPGAERSPRVGWATDQDAGTAREPGCVSTSESRGELTGRGGVRMAVEFRLLGDVEARRRPPVDVGHARQRCVLAALLVEANRPVPVDQLAGPGLGRSAAAAGRGTLRSYLSRLRQVLAAAADVGIDAAAGRLRPGRRPDGRGPAPVPPAGRAGPRGRRRPAAAALFEQALGLWRGEAFAHVGHAVAEQRSARPWTGSGWRPSSTATTSRSAAAGTRGCWPSCRRAPPPIRWTSGWPGSSCSPCTAAAGRPTPSAHYQRVRLRLAEELGADPEPAAAASCTSRSSTADPALTAPSRPRRVRVAGPARAGAAPAARATAVVHRPGRELAELATRAGRRSRIGRPRWSISAIGGAGGIGKTWLALRWAHDNLDRFPDGQLYVNLRGFDPAGEPVAPAVALRALPGRARASTRRRSRPTRTPRPRCTAAWSPAGGC